MPSASELKIELAAVDKEWEAKRAEIQHLRAIDRVQNEGGEGYSSYETAAEDLANKYWPRISELQTAIFVAEWSPEVTAQRRDAWNAEIAKLGPKSTWNQVKAIIERLGYDHKDIDRAKALHSANQE